MIPLLDWYTQKVQAGKWRMTISEAQAALNIAPADDQMSAVEPNMKRRDVVWHLRRTLGKIRHGVIDVSPALARMITCAVQDCPDPVELRFAYDPYEGEGGNENGSGSIVVGWNKEEVEIRKGLKPRPGPITAKTYEAFMEKLREREEERLREMAFEATQNNYHDFISKNLELTTPAIALTPQQLKELIAMDVIKSPPQCPADAAIEAIRQKLREARAAQIVKEPVPEPKPDPSDPKFVLKRPKPS